ncbi:rhodanese-related sulfurtransferase [Halobacillus shinanisalinarum]|uniref:tRNA uridine(34) hydroxylase n=1 Tax=Halobacillus shinanisalinarum TaxID=2932258 RepID=A0ABY4H5Q4_9BACI|nr:rhodanese-related sulfurtransferase [Halobacillus shinanisalinarum]UOQ95255.1 rhodanese-related sulfurtransferase [Halobacillus shinanisalinarum]
MSSQDYRVLLYYKYVDLPDYEEYCKNHLKFCKDLDLRGRIIVSPEGINGTVSGTVEQVKQYMDYVRSDERFADIHFKIDEHEGHAFKKMHCRVKPELVNWSIGDDDIDPKEFGGKHLKPKEFYEMLQDDDTVVIDGRNEYEYRIGHFRNAIQPGVEHSREFPEWIAENADQWKDKKVITYCTGGVRCEKLTGILMKNGVEDVYQLEGGVNTYGKDPEVKGQLFDGKLYVFDERISVPVNQVEEKVVAKCEHCGKAEDRMINCSNPVCNRQYVCCADCEEEQHAACTTECKEHPENRWDAVRKKQIDKYDRINN